MGYKNYLGYISEFEYKQIKNLTNEQLFKFKNLDINHDYLSGRKLVTQLFEFGKYVDYGNFTKNKFFNNKELNDSFNEDGEFVITDKSCLEYFINLYNEKIKEYYLNLSKGIEEYDKLNTEQLNSITSHIISMNSEWNILKPFNLEKGEEITTSWKFEYEIFELIRIYKSFNYKKNYLVYYGW